MKHLILCAFMLIIFIPETLMAQDNPLPSISAHTMNVTIIPADNTIIASDRISLSQSFSGYFSFTLNSNLSIEKICIDNLQVPFNTTIYQGDGIGEMGSKDNLNVITANIQTSTANLDIFYSGKIFDPISPSNALTHVRGDFTSGIISEEGVYLSPETGWYPDTANSLATFEITAHVPENWKTVTQGNLIEEKIENNQSISFWTSDIPFDGCTLVANKYFVTSRNINGVKCSTYFYEDNPELANSFLTKLEEYLPAYTELLGKFPYSRFDIVENFFSTGYGMPGFTLLGSRVLTMPYATAEGSLAHELVHNWWGNFVFVDWEKGNWCEGLTYFCTNYYWNVIKNNEEKARDFRFRSMLKYSIQVDESDEYPVRQFRTKKTETDGNIGYDKSSAIFIMLHEKLGKEDFFKALRLMVERYGGKKATWDNFREVFEEVSEKNFRKFFLAWLDNKGTPELQVDVSINSQGDNNSQLIINIDQSDEFFPIPFPFKIYTEERIIVGRLNVASEDFSLKVNLDTKPVKLELDPDYFVFRCLSRNEIPPCLNSTLESEKLLIVLPSKGADDFVEIQHFDHSAGISINSISVYDMFRNLADQIIESGTPALIKHDFEVTEEDIASHAVFCLGSPSYNTLSNRLSEGSPLSFSDDGFSLNGKVYNSQDIAGLATIRNPYNDSHDISFYFGNSPKAMFKAEYIFFYGWDSWVIFSDGNPIERGTFPAGSNPLIFNFDHSP